MKFCPNDACTNMMIFKLNKLREVDPAGEGVDNAARVFQDGDFEWSSPIHESVDGVNRTKVEVVSNITVGEATTPARFHLTTYLYTTNGTSQNANLTLDIPEGAFKFSLNITNWPWKSVNNSLQFGLRGKIVTRDGNWTRTKNQLKKFKNHRPNVDKVDFGFAGVSIESPVLCDLDGSPATMNSTIAAETEDDIKMDWTFPHFQKYLFYDPVFSQDDEAYDADVSESSDDSTTGDGAMSFTLSSFLSASCLMLISTLFA